MSKSPVEEFMAVSKTANVFRAAARKFPQHMAHAAVGAAAAGAVGLVGAGLGSAVSGIFDAATKGHDFRQMMSANEDLHAHHEQDPKKFNLMFSTLRNVNPQFSKDPLVAGSFMRRMIESPMGIGGIAGEALKHRGDYPDTAFSVAHDYARDGAKAGITESFKQKTPEEMFAQQLPQMNYQHALQENLHKSQFGRQSAERQQSESSRREFDRAQQIGRQAHESRQSKAQRAFQAALARMPEFTQGTKTSPGGRNDAGEQLPDRVEHSESTKRRY